MAGRAAILLLLVLLAGCASDAPMPPQPPAPPAHGDAAAAPALVDEAMPAAEADLVVLPSGRILVCALPQRASDEVLLYASDDGLAFERLAHPDLPSLVDCAWGLDASGRAYLASSAGPALLLATTMDGAAFDRAGLVGAGGAYDRPWIAGGAEGAALAIAYDAARARVVAFATEDGGASWSGPHEALPPLPSHFQVFGNPAHLGGASFAFPFALLAPVGAALEARELHVALSDDGGRTWRSEPVPADVRGNVAHFFPSAAAEPGGALLVAWAEERAEGKGVQVRLARRGAEGVWEAPEDLHPANATGLMPRVVWTGSGARVAMYLAEGDIDPQQEPATWRFVVAGHEGEAWETVVLDEAAHEGTVATGGYGILPRELLQPGTRPSPNASDLLHNVGAAADPAGGARFAWTRTSEAAGDPRVLAGHLLI